jgi:hypothetical protein
VVDWLSDGNERVGEIIDGAFFIEGKRIEQGDLSHYLASFPIIFFGEQTPARSKDTNHFFLTAYFR